MRLELDGLRVVVKWSEWSATTYGSNGSCQTSSTLGSKFLSALSYRNGLVLYTVFYIYRLVNQS